MHIEIITTPNEALKESGFGARAACGSVLSALEELGHCARLSVCQTKHDLDAVAARKPDLVIPAVKYVPLDKEDNIWLSDYFSDKCIHFTGSAKDVLEFDSNKVLAKTHLANKGIKTAKYFIAVPGQFSSESELPFAFPLFLKPLDAANGNGIDDLSFVTDFDHYESKMATLYAEFKQPVLVEEYLSGREFTVAVIKTSDDALIVSAVEVIPPISLNGLRILGAQTKKDDAEKLVEIDDDQVKSEVAALAVDAFNSLGVRDFGRIDVKSNSRGECFFMEVNLVPGMTYGSSYFPQACAIAHQFDYNKVVELILIGGLARASSTGEQPFATRLTAQDKAAPLATIIQ